MNQPDLHLIYVPSDAINVKAKLLPLDVILFVVFSNFSSTENLRFRQVRGRLQNVARALALLKTLPQKAFQAVGAIGGK
ncbi:hypothetical protein AAF134_01670 [Synechococcus lacustris Tous-12m]